MLTRCSHVEKTRKFQSLFLGLSRNRGMRLSTEESKVSAAEIDNTVSRSTFSGLNRYISRDKALPICIAVIMLFNIITALQLDDV